MTSTEGFPFPFMDSGKTTCSTQKNIKTLRSFKHLTPIIFVGYITYVESCEYVLISFLVSHLNLCVWLHEIEGAGLQKKDPEKADSCGVNSPRLALTLAEVWSNKPQPGQ